MVSIGLAALGDLSRHPGGTLLLKLAPEDGLEPPPSDNQAGKPLRQYLRSNQLSYSGINLSCAYLQCRAQSGIASLTCAPPDYGYSSDLAALRSHPLPWPRDYRKCGLNASDSTSQSCRTQIQPISLIFSAVCTRLAVHKQCSARRRLQSLGLVRSLRYIQTYSVLHARLHAIRELLLTLESSH